MKKSNGVTIIELLVVVIIIGIIAAFALPQYGKSLDKARARDAIIQLTTLHVANAIYQAQTGAYYTPGATVGISDINTNLKVNIISNNMTYSYIPSGGTAYSATAASTFTLRINQAPVSATNPCCSAGSCPSRAAC